MRTEAVKRAARRTSKKKKPTKDAGRSEQGLRIGVEATVERIVEHQYTIQALDPNLPAVLSTPAMIGLMEHASVLAVRPHLPSGVITVGTRIEVDRVAEAIGRARTRVAIRQRAFMVDGRRHGTATFPIETPLSSPRS